MESAVSMVSWRHKRGMMRIGAYAVRRRLDVWCARSKAASEALCQTVLIAWPENMVSCRHRRGIMRDGECAVRRLFWKLAGILNLGAAMAAGKGEGIKSPIV